MSPPSRISGSKQVPPVEPQPITFRHFNYDGADTQRLMDQIRDELRPAPMVPEQGWLGNTRVTFATIPYQVGHPSSMVLRWNTIQGGQRTFSIRHYICEHNAACNTQTPRSDFSHILTTQEGLIVRDGLTLSGLHYGRINGDDINDLVWMFSNGAAVVSYSQPDSLPENQVSQVEFYNLPNLLLDLGRREHGASLPFPGGNERVARLLAAPTDQVLLQEFQSSPSWAQGLLGLIAFHASNSVEDLRQGIRETTLLRQRLQDTTLAQSSTTGVYRQQLADHWRSYITWMVNHLPPHALSDADQRRIPERINEGFGRRDLSQAATHDLLGQSLFNITYMSLYHQVVRDMVLTFLREQTHIHGLSADQVQALSENFERIPATLSIISRRNYNRLHPGTGGTHFPTLRLIHLPEDEFRALWVFDVLAHENVHQLVELGHVQNGLGYNQARIQGRIYHIPTWITEGMAEYISQAVTVQRLPRVYANYQNYRRVLEALWEGRSAIFTEMIKAQLTGNYDGLIPHLGAANLISLLRIENTDRALARIRTIFPQNSQP